MNMLLNGGHLNGTVTPTEYFCTSNESWLHCALANLYGVATTMIAPLIASAVKQLYRVEQATAGPLLVRTALATTGVDELRCDADVLIFLERQGYPAPCIISALDGSSVVVSDGRAMCVSIFIEGAAIRADPECLFLLGQVLGQLHALPIATSAPIREAGMLPHRELAYAHGRLSSVQGRVPSALRARYATLDSACRAIMNCGEQLPTVLIHNDCHPANSVLTPAGVIVLIDWEGAGLGPAIIDFGFLLISCAIPLSPGWRDGAISRPWMPPRPDLESLDALIDGYRRERGLTQAELGQLPDAIRFRSLVALAVTFAQQIEQELPDDPAPWWWARYTASAALAEYVQRRLAGTKAD